MDDIRFHTSIELVLGPKALGAMLAGQPVIVSRDTVTLRVMLDGEVRELLKERVQRDDLPTGEPDDAAPVPPPAPEAGSDPPDDSEPKAAPARRKG